MSALGHKPTYAVQYVMSALPQIANTKADFDKPSCPVYLRKRTRAVQKLMSAKGQKRHSSYSISSSARASSDGGTFTPSPAATFRLMVNSNSVACCTGRSPGFAPLIILFT
jgi:hypothetical protein